MEKVEEKLKLNTALHTKYWRMCSSSLLPTGYTSNDSSRMTFGFFILSALDLLSIGVETFPEKDRTNIRDWVLRCQHPNGGFCGSPNHRYPDAYYTDVGRGKQHMDPANLPATFFAILSLSYTGSLDRINRDACLRWLRTLQRDDGSFGELISQEGAIKGGKDMRYCYTATAIRWMLRGDVDDLDVPNGEDINVESLVDHIRSGQTYDGGISESSEHEAHAGYTYCAIAALSILRRLPNSVPAPSKPGLTNMHDTIRWLLSRQNSYKEEAEDESQPTMPQQIELQGVYDDESFVPDLSTEQPEFVGFNGRCNKRVDTCYAFWVAASLDACSFLILGKEKTKLVSTDAIRRFLLNQTQHRIGGFGKCPGDPPDIYHSYLGLAALATLKEPGIKQLDPVLCISMEQKERFGKLRKSALVPTRTYWKHGYSFSIREDDPEFLHKIEFDEKTSTVSS